MRESNQAWDVRPPWRLRQDLRWVRREQVAPKRWIVFDPLNSEYLMMSELEASVAIRLDGRTSLRDLASGFDSDGFPYRVSQLWLYQFVHRLRALGVLLGPPIDFATASPSRHPFQSRSGRAWRWLEWLQVRIPLVDPSSGLDRFAPWFAWLFHRVGRMCWSIAMLLTLTSLVQVWPRFLAEAPYAASSLFSDRWWFLLCILVLTKVAHELGHAIACHAFGARCREMGVMFLLGVPCLYCDVTDAWRIGHARHRAMIAAAGVYVELMIAMVAYWVWVASHVPDVRLGALQICLSSTLVTLLLNGNPLMRYDGYYVMSDWLGISNLAERAREHASRWVQSWMPHRDAPSATRDAPMQVSTALVWYHAASLLYRWFVLAGLLLAVRSAFTAIGLITPHPMVWIGFMAIAAVGIGLKHAWKAPAGVPAGVPGWRRQLWIWMGLSLLLAVMLLIPIPQFHTARGVLQPIDTHPIHARASAFLVECLPDGTDVQAGDVLMRLDSPELRQQSVQIEGEWTVLASRIEQLQRRAVDDPSAPTLLAEALQQREGLLQRRTEFGEELEKLVVRSPVEGRLLYARDLKSNYPAIADAIDSGLPLHELAEDRLWLERGALLAYVQPQQVGWKLQATLAETQLASVHPGMLVKIRLDQSPGSQWAGSIDRIEVIPETRREATDRERSFQNLAERKEWMAENRILGADFRVTVWIRGQSPGWHRDGHGTLGWRGYSVSGWDWLGSKLSTVLAFGSETRNLEPIRVVESSTRTEPFSRWTIERTRNSPSPVPGFFLSNSSPAR